MWNLYKKEGEEFLKPLIFSNGKSQEDIVKEVLDSIKDGCKIIFIQGMCGTGKSAIALNIAKNLGKTSIVVPGKNLQNQYKKDYEENKYILKKNGEKLKISVITGRNNHKCKFLEDNINAIPVIKKEVNSRLNDIFENKRDEIRNIINNDLSADNFNIPCKIEIKEKNWNKIKEYLKQNKKINYENFLDLKDVKRISVAGVCPYWSPVLPEKYDLKVFEDSKKEYYQGLNGTKFVIYKRKSGCKFYEQFSYFVNSDVIVFNSLKYKLESAINRKPLTEVEIIDECDDFLDSFSNQKVINIDRIQNSLNKIINKNESMERVTREINSILKDIKSDMRIMEAIYSNEIIPLKETSIYDLLKIFLNSEEFLENLDEENYIFDIEETAKMFEDFFDDSYVTFNKKENNLTASIVTTNLEKKFKEMLNKNKILVLMSGTLHSNEVLRDIFGLKDFKIIEAETRQQGKIEVQKTGFEIDCKYQNFINRVFSREDYLKSLSKCVSIAKKPALVHINGFNDLPTEKEKREFGIDNLISRERLREIQIEDKTGFLIEKFKKGQTNILFSTRCARGIDFPGEECNSIVFTKYPNPDVKDAFWRILKKIKPQFYWNFYKDKAKRELLQKIYRGLRSKEDHIYLLSPDSRVLNVFEKNYIN